MIKIDFEHCTGCGACVQACPKKCIQNKENNEGFVFPDINSNECIKCNLCEKVCPISNTISKDTITSVYAVNDKNDDACLSATSGGFFGILAEYVLSNGGVIYGCAMCGHDVEHKRASNHKELQLLKGSKYVQSNTKDTFIKAKNDLKSGRLVLYSGTPCQIAGLITFLGREYDNLITADVICHGVPSQAYFRKYIQGLEKHSNGTISDFSFRSKNNRGWSLAGEYTLKSSIKENKKKLYYFESYYYFYFLEGSIYRDSCYQCKYANIDRVSDFTLGDFWGVEGLHVEFDTEKGCSLVITNTTKAKDIFTQLDMNSKEVTVEEAIKHNAQLIEPSKKPSSRQIRLKEYESNTYDVINSTFLKQNKKEILVAKIKYMVPYRLKNLLLKIKYGIGK